MSDLLTHTESNDPQVARLEIDLSRRGSEIPETLFGKFCEHHGHGPGSNVYQGMEAQILVNPVFGRWPFPADGYHPDGGRMVEADLDRIEEHVESWASDARAYPERSDHQAYPDGERLFEAFTSGVAFDWLPLGGDDAVRCSPDTGPTGSRAQRIEPSGSTSSPAGVFQWTYLPAHRVSAFEIRWKGRAVDRTTVTLCLRTLDENGAPDEAIARSDFDVGTEWELLEGTLAVDPDAVGDPDALFAFCIEAESTALVVDRAELYPADHVDHADPEVVDYLRELDLPLLRWPGGNFVSGYDWRDGIGPVDERPVTPNPAWGGLEYNSFGTDEFLAFCAAVGCEPMICVNAGDGTPEDAADWVEYCNGSTDTELGALRAEHGHPEPYDVTHWEIGNETYGSWQVRWTTPEGYVDRYERFRDAMLAVDPTITVHACGNVTRYEDDWNEIVAAESGARRLTDHPLTGGPVDERTDPDELYHAFLGYANQLGRRYRELRDAMEAAGVDDPRLSITELQLFARYEGDPGREDARLVPERMIDSDTITEALYYGTILHECIRMGDFVDTITHTATVNHGGGLRKHRERVWPDPHHHGHAMERQLAGTVPVGVNLECGTVSTGESFDEIRAFDGLPAVDAMAAIDPEGAELTVLAIHRDAECGAIELTVDTGEFDAGGRVDVSTLAGEAPHDRNTREEPDRVSPRTWTEAIDGGELSLALPPYSLTRLTFAADERRRGP